MPRVSRQPPGIFITLEGGEGSGKTTQARRLCRYLTAQGLSVLRTREPGGTLLAERIRTILLNRSKESVAPETEALLILAARRQHVDHVIKPALAQGKTVVCDRFSDSTMAYQGYGRGLALRTLRTMNDWATGKLVPHLTLMFDVPVSVGLRRRRGDGSTQNRMDREAEQFHKNVRAGFHVLAKKEPRRILLIDASSSLESVERTVEQCVTSWLKRHRFPQPHHR
ncbi:MAG: dTMP kinase [Nitrospira sp.]|nr:dTMP kinase [Nitrospira sp.]